MGRYAESGLTALSIVYPLQLLMIALAVGTGVGINTVMTTKLGCGSESEAEECAGTGTCLAVLIWFLFAAVCYAFMPAYARMSTDSPAVIRDVIVYGRNACVFSFGLFLESIWTKVIQAYGDMKTPMIAQIIGAVTNIVLDPLLIFVMFGLPEMGIAGAADYVLKDNPNVIRIFIYAPKDYLIGRVMETYGDTKEEAARNIRRSDETRDAYYRNISDAEWGARQSYDLLLDSSIGDEESAEVIEKYVISKQREREKQNVKAVV